MDQQAQKETKQQESKTFLVGEVFDTRYKIMSLIASGGMGELYHAIDQELQREVAIKVMRAEFCSSEDSRERFFKEAKALASLDHPNIVRIFRFGIDEWDEPFLVMEFVQGESLAQELARTGKLSPEKFLFVFTEVLNGLIHAHKNKLVHRDLKPGNIMISADSASAKIIDFGIAKTIAPQAADAGNQTKTNTMIGTPHYMSPEQCKGERGSKLSDIYSIACIMYEALSGHTLYQGDSAFEIMYKQMSEAPPRLLAAAKTEKEKTLAALIDRCLEKEPSRRPQSVEEIRDVFKELIAADLTAFDPAVKKPSHMGRAIAAIVIFNVLLLAVLYSFPAQKPVEEIKIPTKQESILKEVALLSKSADKSQDLFDSLKDGEHKQSTGVQLINFLQRKGNKLLQVGRPEDLAQVYATADRELEICSRLPDKYSGRIASCHSLKARAALKEGKMELAESEFAQCEKVIMEVWGADSKAWQDLVFERSILRMRQRNFAEIATQLAPIIKGWDGHSVESFLIYSQQLDQEGHDRPQLILDSFLALEKYTPRTREERIEMLKISNLLAHQLRSIGKFDRKSGLAAKFSQELLAKIPNPDEELKEQTEKVINECSEFF